LNALFGHRRHFVETIVNGAVGHIPARIFVLGTPDAPQLAFLASSSSAVIHANVQANFAPWRSVFVSPQARRIHQSISHGHRNSDERLVVASWGQLLRSRFRVVNTYSETGIHNPDFPSAEASTSLTGASPWQKQTALPLRLTLERNAGYTGDVIQRQHAHA